MSVRGGSNSRGRGRSSPVSYASSVRGAIVPHPVNPVQAMDIVNRYQVLDQVPRPFNSVLASKPPAFDPFGPSNAASKISQKPIFSQNSSTSDYIVNFEVNLFFVEHFMEPKNNPVKLAAQFFPKGWHFIPFAPYKSLSYYKDILIQTDSIVIKPILDRKDDTKVLYHSLYIKQIISQTEFCDHPSDLHLVENNHFCYYDYIEAWSKVFLYQNQTFSHSWFIQFDHKFKSQIPLWFTLWWSRFGPSNAIIPDQLKAQVTHFSKQKVNPKSEGIPILLQFCSKYKIPWILKWQYNLKTPVQSTIVSTMQSEAIISQHSQISHVSRTFFIKWWDKFDVNRIVGQVQKEFPPIQISKAISKEKEHCSSPSGPSTSLDFDSVSKLSNDELKSLIQVINARVSNIEEDASDKEETGSSQNSINNNDPYNSQLFQDSQDPFAM